MQNARRAARLAYSFEGAKPPGFVEAPGEAARLTRVYRNPIVLAREWQGMLASGECATRADLAGRLGVTRARVTQVLGLLALPPEALQALVALGDPMPSQMVTERRLRAILKMPANQRQDAVRGIVQAIAKS